MLENTEIHHCFRGSFINQDDAHGIGATHVTVLTIRNCDIHHFSGDCIQVDPDIRNLAQTKLWDSVVVEVCRLWTAAFTENCAGFLVGQNPGENGIDTKTFENVALPHRPKMSVRNTEVFGWERNTFISNRAVFNVKYSVDWKIDAVRAYNNQYVFRVRGEWQNTVQGHATLLLTNSLVYNNVQAFRVERHIPDLRIFNCTFANNTLVMQHSDSPDQVGYDVASYQMKNSLFLGTKTADAFAPSNFSCDSTCFKALSSNDFHLSANAVAIDAG